MSSLTEVVFVDQSLSDADISDILSELSPGMELVRLNGSSPGLTQIDDYLQGRSDIDAIHIISHGAEGELQIGSTTIDQSTLVDQAAVLSDIGSHLSANADILLYGCDIAAGSVGQAFINTLAQETGAVVAASTNLSGPASLGGDSVLEASTGPIDVPTLDLSGLSQVLTTPVGSGLMRNKYVQFGFSSIGTLGEGRYAAPGIQYDPNGGHNFLSTADYLLPGSPWEEFTVTANGSSSTNNNASYPTPGMTATEDFSGLIAGSGSTAGDTWGTVKYVTYKGNLKITQTYTLASDDAQVISMQVTLENTGGTSITGVQYSRAIDPDVDSNGLPGATSSTNNVRGASSIAATDIVLGTGPVSGRVIGFYTNSTITHNTGVTYWTTNPQDYLSGTNVGNGDNTIGIGFNIGTMVAGEVVSFSYAYVFAASTTALAASVAEVPSAAPSPVLTAYSVPVRTTNEDTQVQIAFSDLNLSNATEASPGSIVAFVVKAVSSGTLRIGSDSSHTTAWAAGTNDTISSSLNAYWTPALNANNDGTSNTGSGTGVNAFTVEAKDNSGATTATPVQVQVSVTPVNDPPVLLASMTMASINEDPTVNHGNTVAAMFTPLFSDVDSGDTLGGIVITGNTANASTQGQWQYSLDGGANWFDVGTGVSEISGLALQSSARLRFEPVANYNSTVTATPP